jgi:hypothetical protein
MKKFNHGEHGGMGPEKQAEMPHFEMLPKAMDASFRKCYRKLFLFLCLDTVHWFCF